VHAQAQARDTRSAIAFLRHAAEIAGEMGESARRAVLLRELARLHECCGDLCAALAAERGAHAEGERAGRHRVQELALSARARSIAARLRLEHDHVANFERAKAAHAGDVRNAYGTLERLRETSHEVMTAADAPGLVACVERSVAQVADVHFVGLYVADSSGRALTRYAREGGRALPVRDVPSGDLESYAARAARERREMHVELESVRSGAAELRDCATLWFGPVIAGEEVLGVLTLQSRVPRAFGEGEKVAFRALCGHAAVALENARLREALRVQRGLRIETEERMRRLASVDALTGLATRAHFFAMARERLERARRDGGPCGVIIADVDAFKAVNDVHGHAAGDRVLAAVAATIARHLHGDDVAGRIGAEEFAVLLPGATLEATVAAAERMRIATEAQVIAHDGAPLMVTMSFGCTAIADLDRAMGDKPAAATVERMVRDADAALYEAQGTGGNRAIAWPAYEALRDMRLGAALTRDPQSFA
jgi:diguanylate cyclase (GGDEF)-like protein